MLLSLVEYYLLLVPVSFLSVILPCILAYLQYRNSTISQYSPPESLRTPTSLWSMELGTFVVVPPCIPGEYGLQISRAGQLLVLLKQHQRRSHLPPNRGYRFALS